MNIEMNQGTSKYVKPEVKALKIVQDHASIGSVEEMVQDIIVKNIPKKQPYNIATGRKKRQIKALINGYIDLVNFTLIVVENFDDHELCSYKEMISYKDFSQWILVMNEETDSFYKNRILELVKPLQGQKIVRCHGF